MFRCCYTKNVFFKKKAAKEVGLNRQVVQVSYSGNTKHETVDKLCDITTCHVARKTFIEVADETTARELAKWELQSKKVEIGILLEKASDDKLEQVLKLLRA